MVLDEIYQSAKEQYTTVGNKCVVGQWAATLNEKDKDARTEYLIEAKRMGISM